jgi:hypothetical protein
MGYSGVFRQVGDNDVFQQDRVVALRRSLAEMGHPSVAIQWLSPLELMDVVVRRTRSGPLSNNAVLGGET